MRLPTHSRNKEQANPASQILAGGPGYPSHALHRRGALVKHGKGGFF